MYYICIPSQLLQFSQQLCSRLEQLVLLYASFSFFSLEESDPLRYKPIINHRQNLGRYINEGEDSEETDPLLAQKEGLILAQVGFHIGVFLLLLLFPSLQIFSFFTVSLTSILASVK